MNRFGLFVSASIFAAGCGYVATINRPETQDYGPPVPPASIITLSPEEDALYFSEVPVAEQGEGGPDSVPEETIPPEPWWIPADQCTDVRKLLAEHDLIGPTKERLVWIAMQESDCGAYSVNEGSSDYGIWQINWPTWGAPLCKNADICTTPWELAHDDDIQAEAVAVLLEWEGWAAWCWSTPDHHARGIGYECPWGIEEQG